MIRRPPRSTPKPSSAASDVYKRQVFKVVIEFEFEKLVVDDSTPMSEGGLICYGISAQPDFFPFIVPGTSTMDILKEIK